MKTTILTAALIALGLSTAQAAGIAPVRVPVISGPQMVQLPVQIRVPHHIVIGGGLPPVAQPLPSIPVAPCVSTQYRPCN